MLQVDKDFTDSYGLTAYDYAVDYEYDSIITLLEGDGWYQKTAKEPSFAVFLV